MSSQQETTAFERAKAWCKANVEKCPRSPEWKHGARSGAFKAHGQVFASSPWASGTAQDDARNSGFDYGYTQAKHELKAGAGA
ncbi:hypothetical protein A1D30_05545 [Acidovorax sp. GW101-3H11]|uniref:hypothetical protein n=1 Tax=Acidovorax sp. GW101-3H11 TaxID=1813946 RepID=UPI0007B523A3|nr:hypothetical protein [Acidovorax sp. GW101-3H11]KZT11675.1 hypothetical protein A1D30_05545 [Acidovorax sp. GW101-3H11]